MNMLEPQAHSPKPLRSQPLKALNQQAIKNFFDIEDVPWSLKIDPMAPWMPDSLIYTSYLSSYPKLSLPIQLKFNQLTALAICEQFIWLEEELLCPILAKVLATQTVSEDLRVCLENFITEERKHSEMFRRTLKKADTKTYSTSDHNLYKLGSIQQRFFGLMINYPEHILSWIWLAIFFEEKTLLISRHYARVNDQPVDGFFKKVHHMHLLDEARHLQIDQYLLEELYDNASPIKRRLSAQLVKPVFKAFTSPSKTSLRIIEKVLPLAGKQDRKVLEKIKTELPQLNSNQEFKDAMLGEKAMPRTRKLLEQYPELASALKFFG